MLFLLTFFGGHLILYFWAHKRIEKALREDWFPPSIEFYSSPSALKRASSLEQVQNELIYRNFTPQSKFNFLKPKEFINLPPNPCMEIMSSLKKIPEPLSCISWINQDLTHYLVLEDSYSSFYFYTLKPSQKAREIIFDPVLFAQKEGDVFQLRQKLKLKDTPLTCLQAITLSEDQNFLLHRGASFKGIIRAFLKNIKHLGIKEGGSTITQQLVKNKFLTSQRTFRRKFIELILSIALEQKLTKDEILELYLNTVYMGRNKFYSIYGFASASQHYFNKPISRMNVAECSLLSVLVQSPGRYNPFLNPKQTLQRRNSIIQKLYENKFITKDSFDLAQKAPLPSFQKEPKTQGSYFVQSLQEEIDRFEIPSHQNLKVYTTLDLEIQKQAQNAVQKALKELEHLKKDEIKSPLEASLIHIDLRTNHVKALIGGRNFNQSPYNRALQSRRPIGSLVKPFVFLSAFLKDSSLSPTTLVEDVPFSKEEKWQPQNYKNKFYGEVPIYFALKESLNSVSARLGTQTGLSQLTHLLKNLGFQRNILEVPAITLGAIDMTPFELSQIYSTLARMGSYQKLSLIQSIIYSNTYLDSKKEKQVLSIEDSAVMIGMMKHVMLSGTASWVRPYITFPVAGKTGTSNEERDSWFVGFTPHHLTTIWVGLDDNTPHGLSGTSGALLIWLYFMQNLKIQDGQDFNWPKKVISKDVPLFTKDSKTKETTIPLIFKKPKRRFFGIDPFN